VKNIFKKYLFTARLPSFSYWEFRCNLLARPDTVRGIQQSSFYPQKHRLGRSVLYIFKVRERECLTNNPPVTHTFVDFCIQRTNCRVLAPFLCLLQHSYSLYVSEETSRVACCVPMAFRYSEMDVIDNILVGSSVDDLLLNVCHCRQDASYQSWWVSVTPTCQ